MPQDRTLIHAEIDLRVERVRSHPTPTQWSPAYVTDAPRFVLPMSCTAVDIRAQNKTWLIDSLTALSLGPNLAYRICPSTRSVRESLVISGENSVANDDEPMVWLLCTRTLFLIHLASCRGWVGASGAGIYAGLLNQISHGARLSPCVGAVARARRLLVTAPGNYMHASMHDIADAAAVSAFHLARSFRRQTGLSLHQYRQRLRLASVLQRLSEGERDLPGLAHDHGFCSQSHLGSVFHKEVGVTLGRARSALGHRL
jgi:AraC-like DNA-binding protein